MCGDNVYMLEIVSDIVAVIQLYNLWINLAALED